jgi:hypothetical protein
LAFKLLTKLPAKEARKVSYAAAERLIAHKRQKLYEPRVTLYLLGIAGQTVFRIYYFKVFLDICFHFISHFCHLTSKLNLRYPKCRSYARLALDEIERERESFKTTLQCELTK